MAESLCNADPSHQTARLLTIQCFCGPAITCHFTFVLMPRGLEHRIFMLNPVHICLLCSLLPDLLTYVQKPRITSSGSTLSTFICLASNPPIAVDGRPLNSSSCHLRRALCRFCDGIILTDLCIRARCKAKL